MNICMLIVKNKTNKVLWNINGIVKRNIATFHVSLMFSSRDGSAVATATDVM